MQDVTLVHILLQGFTSKNTEARHCCEAKFSDQISLDFCFVWEWYRNE